MSPPSSIPPPPARYHHPPHLPRLPLPTSGDPTVQPPTPLDSATSAHYLRIFLSRDPVTDHEYKLFLRDDQQRYVHVHTPVRTVSLRAPSELLAVKEPVPASAFKKRPAENQSDQHFTNSDQPTNSKKRKITQDAEAPAAPAESPQTTETDSPSRETTFKLPRPADLLEPTAGPSDENVPVLRRWIPLQEAMAASGGTAATQGDAKAGSDTASAEIPLSAPPPAAPGSSSGQEDRSDRAESRSDDSDGADSGDDDSSGDDSAGGGAAPADAPLHPPPNMGSDAARSGPEGSEADASGTDASGGDASNDVDDSRTVTMTDDDTGDDSPPENAVAAPIPTDSGSDADMPDDEDSGADASAEDSLADDSLADDSLADESLADEDLSGTASGSDMAGSGAEASPGVGVGASASNETLSNNASAPMSIHEIRAAITKVLYRNSPPRSLIGRAPSNTRNANSGAAGSTATPGSALRPSEQDGTPEEDMVGQTGNADLEQTEKSEPSDQD